MEKNRREGPPDLAARISAILWNDWDPIGVNDAPETKREYDSYVPAILKMVEKGATPGQIAEYLIRVEKEEIGLTAGNALEVASKICRLS